MEARNTYNFRIHGFQMNHQTNTSKSGISSSQPLITVAICTYNRYQLLRELIATLANQSLPRPMFEILVVDNTDNEADRRRFEKEAHGHAGLEVVYSFPPGLSRARNMAIEKCRTKYIVFIDDDAFPAPEWLSSLLDVFRKSGASAVAGPIDPIWPAHQPDWLPEKYIGCLTILDHGHTDRKLSEYEFAYGTNMAFSTDALREVGGFNVGLGRIGSRTLISDEEIETQIALRTRGHKVFYAAAAKVFHRVHENRLSRNYFRARMAWQAVSTLMHDSPLWWPEQSRQEIIRVSAELGISEFVQRLFTPQDAATFSAQIDLIYHLFLVILDSNNESDAVFEQRFANLLGTTGTLPAGNGASVETAISYSYRGIPPIGLDTRHLFVDSPSSHAFLFDVYADIPGSQMITFRANLWDRYDEELENLENSLAPQLQTLTFLTLEPLVFGPRWPQFKALLNRLMIPVFGILHRLPWTNEQAALLREASGLLQMIVLAESMTDRLRDSCGIANVLHLPLHPTHSIYIGREGKEVRERIGALPEQVIFSVLGEARKGKGIELLLAALEHVAPEDRKLMFFLFAGRAKDVSRQNVENQLIVSLCSGYVDLRQSADPLNYAVLTERELGQYINITDVGILLYQDDQRSCMSGILPNYVWGHKPVIATSDSVVGDMAQKYGLGITVTKETPRSVAEALTTALHACRAGSAGQYANESLRTTITAKAVVQRFLSILKREITPALGACHGNPEYPQPENKENMMINFRKYLDNLPLLHSWDGGQTWNTGGFQREHLEKLHGFLKKNLPPAPRLLETGAGNSTISLLFLSPGGLISIAPEPALFDRIRAYCEANGIPAEALEVHVNGSEWVLPKLAEEMKGSPLLDFVLIDGCHNWPMAFVDFFYCNYMLKPGGYIMIDDVQLHSVKELARMLSEQPGFELALDLGKSLVFRRTSEARTLGEWGYLPYIVRKSNEYAQMRNPFHL